MTKTHILLADDHAVLRAGLRLLIEAQAERLQPDLVLLDLSLPRLGGPAALPEVRRKAPQTRVLVLTMHADDEYLRQCLKGGAAGYVLKQAADQELLLAIWAVMRGEVYIHPAMMRALLGDLVDRARDPSGLKKPEGSAAAELSEREAEVIMFILSLLSHDIDILAM